MGEQRDAARQGRQNACAMDQGVGADFVPRIDLPAFEE